MAKKATPETTAPAPDEAVASRFELVTTEATPVSVSAYEEEDFEAGFEDFTADDVSVPFLAIFQKGSPQVEEDNPKYVKGAKAGMLFNTASGAMYEGKETGVCVIPVHRTRQYIEWIPKDDGGGLVAVYEPDAPEVTAVLGRERQYGKVAIHEGNELVETFSVFALCVAADGTFERVIISFASSQIATYKRWMTKAQNVTVLTPDGRRRIPPMFAHRYRLGTVFHQKKENTWFKFTIEFDHGDARGSRLSPNSELYHAAKAFRSLVTAGRITAAYEQSGADHDTADVTMESDMEM